MYRGNIPLRIQNVEKHVDILYKESMPKCRNEPRRNVIRVGRSTATLRMIFEASVKNTKLIFQSIFLL